MSEYPEHDKLAAIATESQAVGEFIDWLGTEKGVQLMTWVEQDEDVPCTGWLLSDCNDGKNDHGRTCQKCHGTGLMTQTFRGWVPQPTPIATLLAEHFGIDQRALEQEKRAMLRTITNN